MNLVRPKIVGGISLVVILILLASLAQEMNRRLQVQEEVETLQLEVQKMERNIVELENLNQYFRTDAYQERLAREKLNYQLPGERVVLIPDNAQALLSAQQQRQESPRVISIPERWWQAFFAPEPISAD